MQQYNTQYGTIFAVREYKGHPAIMLRAEHKPDDWSLSSMIEPFTPGAWTAEELQGQLDSWAATKGWQPVEAPASAEPPEIVDEGSGPEEDCLPQNPTDAAPASRADAGAAEQSPSVAGPASLEAPLSASSAFDYTGLDDQTVADLHLAEREVARGKRMAEIGLRRMADGVAIAHDALCVTIATKCRNGKGAFSDSEKTFGRWCESVGLNRKAAERLLQVSKLFDNSTPREEKVLEELGPSLLYAAAKPSAPAELVQAVKDGDITTHKQYQEALAEIRARDEKITELLEMSEAADRRAEEEQRKRKEADEARIAAENKVQQYREIKDAALETAKQQREKAANADARARAAENRAAGAQKLADQRGTENTDLRRKLKEAESRPIDIAVAEPSEADKERWRKEGEDRMAVTLQDTVLKAHKAKITAENQVADLQEQLAAARPDADACQRTADTLYETTENLRLLLRTQLKLAQLPPDTYGKVVAHVLQAADTLRDTVRSCAPAGYTMDDDEEDFL